MALVSELETKLTVNSNDFAKGMLKATAITAAFTTVASKLINTLDFSGNIKQLDELNDKAVKLGTSFESIQSLAYAAKLSGTSIESLNAGMRTFIKVLDGANTGSKEAVNSLARIGLTMNDLRSLSLDEQFSLVSAQIRKIPSSTEQAAIAMELFGRAGLDLTQLLKSDVGALTGEFDKLGIGISNSQAKAVAKFADTKDAFSALVGGIKDQIAANLAPAFTLIIEKIMGSAAAMFDLKAISATLASSIITAFSKVLETFDFLEQKLVRTANIITAVINGISQGLNESVLTQELSNSKISKLPYADEAFAGKRYEDTRNKLNSLATDLTNQARNSKTTASGGAVINVAQELQKFNGLQGQQNNAKIQIEASKDFIVKVVQSEGFNTKVNQNVADLIAQEARGVAR